jgi:hypothetical protein
MIYIFAINKNPISNDEFLRNVSGVFCCLGLAKKGSECGVCVAAIGRLDGRACIGLHFEIQQMV